MNPPEYQMHLQTQWWGWRTRKCIGEELTLSSARVWADSYFSHSWWPNTHKKQHKAGKASRGSWLEDPGHDSTESTEELSHIWVAQRAEGDGPGARPLLLCSFHSAPEPSLWSASWKPLHRHGWRCASQVRPQRGTQEEEAKGWPRGRKDRGAGKGGKC